MLGEMPGCYAVFHKQLGDLVLLEPTLRRLAAYHGGPVRLATRSGHAPLLELMPDVELQAGWSCRIEPCLYCFDPLNKSALRSALLPALAKHCILPEKREMQWFHPWLFRSITMPELRNRYVAEYFWKETPAPITEPFQGPRLSTPPASWKPSGLEDRPFVLLNPTAGWRKKSWVAERWAEVITALHSQSGQEFLMTSGSTDWQKDHCDEIVRLAGSSVRYFTGSSLEEFLWLCAHAETVLTVDGSASHLAAAFGVKNLTLFGPTSMENWHFPTSHSVAVQAPASKDGIRRLRDLPVAEVLQATGRLFSPAVA